MGRSIVHAEEEEEGNNFFRFLIDQATNSLRAREILSDWAVEKGNFVRVMPRDYKNALRALEKKKTDQNGVPEGEKALLQYDAANGQVRMH